MPTHTRTSTSTFTSTRIYFLKTQVRIALRRSISTIDENTLARVFDTAIEKKYFKQIDIFGLGANNLCRAHLKIVLDWERHQIHIKEGRENIAVPDKWLDTGAIEVDEMTKLFMEFVKDNDLRTIWQATWNDGVNIDLAQKELGTGPAIAPKWSGKPEGISANVSLADEMNIGCFFSG